MTNTKLSGKEFITAFVIVGIFIASIFVFAYIPEKTAENISEARQSKYWLSGKEKLILYDGNSPLGKSMKIVFSQKYEEKLLPTEECCNGECLDYKKVKTEKVLEIWVEKSTVYTTIFPTVTKKDCIDERNICSISTTECDSQYDDCTENRMKGVYKSSGKNYKLDFPYFYKGKVEMKEIKMTPKLDDNMQECEQRKENCLEYGNIITSSDCRGEREFCLYGNYGRTENSERFCDIQHTDCMEVRRFKGIDKEEKVSNCQKPYDECVGRIKVEDNIMAYQFSTPLVDGFDRISLADANNLTDEIKEEALDSFVCVFDCMNDVSFCRYEVKDGIMEVKK